MSSISCVSSLTIHFIISTSQPVSAAAVHAAQVLGTVHGSHNNCYM